MWICPICGEKSLIGMAIGTPTCIKDGAELVEFRDSQTEINVPQVAIGGKVTVGGNLSNSGKIKVFQTGELNVQKDLINTGDISISDPEKIKQLLVEVVKTSGNLAELGSNVLKTFFQK